MRTRMEERGGAISDVSRVAWEEGWVTGAVMYIAATSGVTAVYLAVTPTSSFRTGGVHICPHGCPGLCWDRRAGNEVAVIYLTVIPRVTPRYPTVTPCRDRELSRAQARGDREKPHGRRRGGRELSHGHPAMTAR